MKLIGKFDINHWIAGQWRSYYKATDVDVFGNIVCFISPSGERICISGEWYLEEIIDKEGK